MRKQVYNLYGFLTGKNYKKHSDLLEQTQYWEYEKIKEFQWKRLKSILEHAYSNVPYYREKYDKAGIKPNNIKNFTDIKNIPFLSKEDIRSSYKDLLAKDKNRKQKVIHTSGSTGKPLEIVVDYEACAQYGAPKRRAHKWYGIDPLAKWARIWGIPLTFKDRTLEHLKDFASNCIRLSTFDLSDKALEDFYKRCIHFQPVYLYGYTSALFRFAQYLEEKGWGKELRLKIVIPTSEVIYDFQRKLMERVFGCKVVAEYGTVETGVIAYECPYGKLHYSPENLFLEIVKKDGTPANLGEYGEVVLTSLCNYAMPLIRYKIGDVSAIYKEDCPCGVNSGFPLLKPIMGRTVDLNQPLAVETYYAVYYVMESGIQSGAIKEYQAIRRTQEEVVVKIVKGIDFDLKIPHLLCRNIKKALGESVKVQIEYVNKIERESSDKKRYFISGI